MNVPAVFAKDGNNVYSVFFPDLPGCLTEGDSLEEALDMAASAMRLHIYGMEADGDPLPTPTPPEDVRVDEGFVSLVSVWLPPFRKLMARKSVKKTLTIPKWLNDIAEREGVNFSYLLQKSLKEFLKETLIYSLAQEILLASTNFISINLGMPEGIPCLLSAFWFFS